MYFGWLCVEMVKNIPVSKNIKIYVKHFSREKPEEIIVIKIPTPIDVDIRGEEDDVVVLEDFRINDGVSLETNSDDGCQRN